jgi:hypothetical protein
MKVANITKSGPIASNMISMGISTGIGRRIRIITAKHASTINPGTIHAKLFPMKISFSETGATSKDFI